MSTLCRVGWHAWQRAQFVHVPCVQDNREYGWSWKRCTRCDVWQSPMAPLAPRSAGRCACVPRYVRDGWTALVEALGEVLNVEAGLAEIVNAPADQNTEEDPRR